MKKSLLLKTLLLIVFMSCNPKKTEQTIDKVDDPVKWVSFTGNDETSLPHLFSKNGETLLSWVRKINDSTTQFNYTHLNSEKWAEPKEIITGSNWFVNWADYPSITNNNGNLLAHFLKKTSPKTFAYDIKLNLLQQDSEKWKTEMPLHIDGTKTEHGFVTTLPYGESSFFITWLDGRNMGSDTGHDHSGAGGAMTIRAAEVSFDGTISNAQLLDAKTCSCCQTTAAITANGPIVLYRDRTDEEVRDIAITRRINGRWTQPKFIHDDGWVIKGCPVNGPKVGAFGNNVAVAWFTAVNEEPKVQVVFSKNGGADFTKPILVSSSEPLGRVDLVMIDKDNAIVSWMETEEKTTYLKVMKVNSLGAKSTPIKISVLDGSRKTGFPQMELVRDKLYFAWTALAKETSTIKTAYIDLAVF